MMYKKNKSYLDLISKDKIIINVGLGKKLEIIVNDIINKKSLELQIIDGIVYDKNLYKSNAISIKRHNILIYNYGNRHHGNRVHVRLEMPCYYSYELIRKN